MLALEASTLLPGRRIVLALHATVFAALIALRSRPLRSDRRLLSAFAIGVAGSLLLPTLAMLLPQEDRLGPFGEQMFATINGWVGFLVLLPLFSTVGGGSLPAPPSRSARFGALVAVAALIAGVHWLAVGDLAIVSDEASYLVQSRWMSRPSLLPMWQISADLAPFFMTRKIDYLNGHLYGMYPPGWPALLSVFRVMGLEWWSGVVLGTASVAMMYSVGTRVRDALTGWWAAILLATSQMFLVVHAGYMAHAALMLALLTSVRALLAGLDRTGAVRLTYWALSGFLLAFGVTVRPLTTLTLGTCLVLWIMARAWRESRVTAATMAACIVAGSLVPAALFIAHNNAVLGRPLAVGYQVMHPGLYDLGFGARGFRVLDENVHWVSASFPFTWQMGLQFLLSRLSGINTAFVPVGLLIPLLTAAIAMRVRVHWGLVAAFLVLPLAHLGYWYGEIRLYTELLPFVLLGAAALLVAMGGQHRAAAASWMALLVAGQAMVALPWPRGAPWHRAWSVGNDHNYGYAKAPGRWATLHEARELSRTYSRLLLFTHDDSRYDNLIDRLYPYNGDRFDGPVLVARDRGPLNESLMRRFPDRVAFLVIDHGPEVKADFTRLSPP
jgi:hypothetical protein